MFRFFRTRRSAPVARERLKVLLAHERAFNGKSDLIGILQQEILAVIRKHVAVDPEGVRVRADRSDKISTLTVDIDIPMDKRRAAAA
jgi:cell division topological specificity factor